MKDSVKKEVENLIKKYNFVNCFNCSIEEFSDKVNWDSLCKYQNMSEDFIREFKNKVNIDILIERKLITKKRLEELELEGKKDLEKINNRSYRFKLMDV